MGLGIDWMILVALWVTSLPGSVGRMAAFGTGPLLLCTAGMLLLCLLRSPLRWSGAGLVVAASLWAANAPRPDVLVAADGQTAAFRGTDGQLAVLASGRDTFAIKEWLAADGDARGPKDASLSGGARCDAAGCIGRLADGRLAAMALSVEAFAEDCTRAAVVVSPREAPGACTALLIDRKTWRTNGAMSLRWTGERFEQKAARPAGYDRPWARPPRVAAETASPMPRPAFRDATPQAEDLGADD
jgi:competence protein ComEC